MTTDSRPPDRGHIHTEAINDRTHDLDRLDVEACLRRINDEDRRVPDAVRAAIPAIAPFVEAVAARLDRGGRLIYLGAGTSGRLGVLDASECPPTFQTDPDMIIGLIAGGDAALRRSSEAREDERDGARAELDALDVGPDDAVLGIAAGGTTPWVLGALDLAADRGACTGLLTCADIDRPASVEHCIVIRTGPEAITGSTRMKAGTATKLALNMISTASMVRLGKTYGNLMVDMRATNDKLRDRAARIVAHVCGIPRNEAFARLDDADGSVKHAIVMTLRNVSRDEADALLARTRNRLRDALGDHDPDLT